MNLFSTWQRMPVILLGWALMVGLSDPATRGAGGTDVSSLRLVPFPKEVTIHPGSFSLHRHLLLEVSSGEVEILGDQLTTELVAAGYPAPTVRAVKTPLHILRLSAKVRRTFKRLPLRAGSGLEAYALDVQPSVITVMAAAPPGLYYGIQTLRQLIRANRQEDALPNLTIQDWPSLRWRAFQDDLTRGPSSRLENLKEQAGLGAFFKLNVFTYYMEHQFAFKKHPVIGPPNGSLTADELKALVAYATPHHLNILGNQQSFGHFTAILAHPEFASLRETDYLLCPTNPRTYELLDDLYSEVAPLLPFPYFNVCCDETEGLGEGPSRSVVQQIGRGALYVRHVRQLHDLITTKYHKQMMMWGDIILHHTNELDQLPKDTVLLTWGYDPRPSFEDQILPFKKAGYSFFVCPGVNNWNRILPHFGAASTNIQNFVRDGLKDGAIGMLNTAWDDDGETFNAPNWYGFAWGAECAWTGSTTCVSDFNDRLGAVLFGEKGGAFGRAIEALSNSGVDGMPNNTFWRFNFGPTRVRTVESARGPWEKPLPAIGEALAKFGVCQGQASFNREFLDFYTFGARRMELCSQRELQRLEAAALYRTARKSPYAQALPLLENVESILRSGRDAHESLRIEFIDLWRRENKPYSMDWTVRRYDELIGKYDVVLEKIARARANAKPDRSLPTPREVGLELAEESF